MSSPEPDPLSHLPLGELPFQILLSLGDGPLHGYGIGREISGRTDGRMDPTTGSLYQALRRLARDGLVEEDREAAAGSSDSRRRYYRLTALGRRVAAAEVDRLASLIELARRRRLWGRGAEEVR